MLEHLNINSAIGWSNLGDSYHYGRDGYLQNYQLSVDCYYKALAIDPHCIRANFVLGWVLENGLGVASNIEKAREHYNMASAYGDYNSTKQLLLLDKEKLFSIRDHERRLFGKGTDPWFILGKKFYYGLFGAEQNYIKSRVCFEQSLYNKPTYEANWHLGMIFQFGHGVQRNYNKAYLYYRKWYLLALKQIKLEKKLDEVTKFVRTSIRDLLKEHICEILKQNRDINQIDKYGKTLLHKAAESKILKYCARLVLLGADKSIADYISKLPFDYLDDDEKKVVQNLQLDISRLNNDLFLSSSEILSRNTVTHRTTKPSGEVAIYYRHLEEQLCPHSRNAILPLLKVAKLSCLGLHDFSDRIQFDKVDYDSDNDLNGSVSLEQRLNISLDPSSSRVCNITHFGKSALGGMEALGVYFPGRNSIFVGTKTPEEEKDNTLSTFIHEITHFVTLEVFKNDCKPYSNDDEYAKAIFCEIASDLHRRKDSLPSILRGAFNEYYIDNDQIHGELIVRIPELLVSENGYKGIEILKHHAQDLWNYYNKHFLPKIIVHLGEIYKRCTSYWPVEHMLDESIAEIDENRLPTMFSLPV